MFVIGIRETAPPLSVKVHCFRLFYFKSSLLIQDHLVNFHKTVHEAFRSKTCLNGGLTLYTKGENFNNMMNF